MRNYRMDKKCSHTNCQGREIAWNHHYYNITKPSKNRVLAKRHIRKKQHRIPSQEKQYYGMRYFFYHPKSQFFTIVFPSGVSTLSGWNWMPWMS